jgi:hypothetical protein
MLRARLRELTGAPVGPIDVVVTMHEINDRHGTGSLVKRVFRNQRSVFSIRSRHFWGAHDFGGWNARISQQGCARPECFRNVLAVLGGRRVRSVLCVPFLADEILTSIAIKEAFDARLCAWVMDDQNVAATGIPDGVMREFLEKCSLRLATHPELRLAYERKYGLPFYILPAVVPGPLVLSEPPECECLPEPRKGALLGSFWDQVWFDRLCSILERVDVSLDWFGNHRSPSLKFSPAAMERAGITACGVVPEARLAAELRRRAFVVVPAGALDPRETVAGVASLSLPGRILFAAATSHTPILVVGGENTCAARFVKHFGIGMTAPYDAAAIGAAVGSLSAPQAQREMRARAAAIAPSFSDRGVAEWLESSIESGGPADSRFEEAFSGYNGERDVPLSWTRP